MIGDLIRTALAPIFEGVLRLIPDKNERARAKEQMEGQILNALTGLVQGQLEINQQEAKHPSIFVAGWRPFIGWVCGIALVWNFIVQPLVSWIIYTLAVMGYIDQSLITSIAPPTLNAGELMTVLLGMLGLGGLRTYEKRLGTARENMKGTVIWSKPE